MRTTTRARWGSIALAAVILHGLTAWWSTPACAQGSGTTTFTTSFTVHYTFTGGGFCSQVAPDGCSCAQFSCPLGATPKINHTETSSTTTASLGPGTIFIGPCGSQSFFIPAGTTNINTNTHTETFVHCVPDPSAIPTLSAGALVVMVALMVAGGLLALRRRRA